MLQDDEHELPEQLDEQEEEHDDEQEDEHEEEHDDEHDEEQEDEHDDEQEEEHDDEQEDEHEEEHDDEQDEHDVVSVGTGVKLGVGVGVKLGVGVGVNDGVGVGVGVKLGVGVGMKVGVGVKLGVGVAKPVFAPVSAPAGPPEAGAQATSASASAPAPTTPTPMDINLWTKNRRLICPATYAFTRSFSDILFPPDSEANCTRPPAPLTLIAHPANAPPGAEFITWYGIVSTRIVTGQIGNTGSLIRRQENVKKMTAAWVTTIPGQASHINPAKATLRRARPVAYDRWQLYVTGEYVRLQGMIGVRGDLGTATGLASPVSPAEVLAAARRIGAAAAPHAARHDRDASFVTEGYEAIRATGFGAIAVPGELGGGGQDLATVCAAQATLARYCANTSLAICMHQHNVLTLAWRWRLGDRAVEPALRRIVTEGLVLASSGSADPANPGVTGVPVEGGLLVSGRKRFCSGVPGADAVATMARVEDEAGSWTTTVLIPMPAPGAEIIPDWDAMGMRGSGSNPVSFAEVFVPQANIIDFAPLQPRPGPGPARMPDDIDQKTSGHRLPGLQIALAVITSVYLGAAGAMRDRALRLAARKGASDPAQQRLAGLLTQEYRSARWALDAYIAQTTDDAVGSEQLFVTAMLAKRQVVLASIRVVELAMELLGSRSYLRALPFEQALRDVRAGITHPLSPEKTLLEVGRSALRHFADQPDS